MSKVVVDPILELRNPKEGALTGKELRPLTWISVRLNSALPPITAVVVKAPYEEAGRWVFKLRLWNLHGKLETWPLAKYGVIPCEQVDEAEPVWQEVNHITRARFQVAAA